MAKIKPNDKYNDGLYKISKSLEKLSEDIDNIIKFYDNSSSKKIISDIELENLNDFKNSLSNLSTNIKYRPL
jgi:hypothetical protein